MGTHDGCFVDFEGFTEQIEESMDPLKNLFDFKFDGSAFAWECELKVPRAKRANIKSRGTSSLKV